MANAPGNDYNEHARTYRGFMALLKISIVALAFTVVSLYCFIEAHQPWLGLFLLIIAVPAGFAVNMMTSEKK